MSEKRSERRYVGGNEYSTPRKLTLTVNSLQAALALQRLSSSRTPRKSLLFVYTS